MFVSLFVKKQKQNNKHSWKKKMRNSQTQISNQSLQLVKTIR